MKLSLNYLKKYLDFELPKDNQLLLDKIGAQLGATDELPISLGPIYEPVIVARVVESKPLEGSDHLKLCYIDDGGRQEAVERNPKNLVQVVCGAPNVEAGQLVAWLPPGSIVPSTYHKEPFTLTARKMLGETSNGMLASPKELAIGDAHEGILIIDKECNPGDSFMELYDLDDYIIDIENKMFTHRPDCFGLLGVARELAGVFNQPFKSPEWYLSPAILLPDTDTKPFKVVNEIPELVPRFTSVAMDNIVVGPSPIATQSYLSRMGIRPINNIVDATNLIMLETGQPLHAYDYQKLQKLSKGEVTITVRYPRPSETIKLLNGKTIAPGTQSIMIAAGDTLVGLAGVMGAEDAEVDSSTKAIIIEAASFDMYSIRRASMEFGIFSDAVTRFSKGQSPLQNKRVLTSCSALIKTLTGGQAKVASEVVDINNLAEATFERKSLYPPVVIDQQYINSRLGSDLSIEQMAGLLTNVECQVETDGNSLTVKPPFWRTDIEIREDVVEEIGRLYGYDNIAPKLLNRLVKPTEINDRLELKANLRNLLARAGANELLTYSFVSKKLLDNANQDASVAYELANSLSPELEFYRPSLTPSLLAKVHPNIKSSFDKFALFELGTYHLVGSYDQTSEALPTEFQSLALTHAASKNSVNGAAYYQARSFLDYLLNEFGIAATSYSYQALDADSADSLPVVLSQIVKSFEPSRSALLVDKDGNKLGVVGEYRIGVQKNFKLPAVSAGFEVDLSLFDRLAKTEGYKRLSRFPSVKQDITLKAAANLSYADLYSGLLSKLDSLNSDQTVFVLKPLSIFRSDKDKASKNYSFRLVVTDYQRTLSDKLVNGIMDQLASYAETKFKATRV